MKPNIGALAALCGLLAWAPADAATRLVSTTGADAGDCTGTPCATVTFALTQALAGDVISLAAGTYAENVLIDKSVTIAGTPPASSTVVVPAVSQPTCITGGGSLCGALANSSNVLVVQASNVEIRDLTVDGDNPALTSGMVRGGADLDARNGIIENYMAGVFNGTNIHDVVVKNIYLRGIYAASQGAGFVIEDVTVDNVQGEYASIAVFNYGGSGIVRRCTVSRANDAIAANWSRGTQFLDNSVTTSGSGVHSDNNGGFGGVADTISGNTVTNSTPNGYGIWVFVPYVTQTIENNTITNVDVGLCASGSGANVTPLFTGNTVTGTNADGGAGFYATTWMFGWGSSNVRANLQGNTFTNTTEGLFLEAETGFTATVTATGNTIVGASGSGVFFSTPGAGAGTYTVALHFNRIAGNGVGLSNPIAGNAVAAEQNWWGCNGGPGAVTPLGTCNAVTGAGTTATAPVLVLGVSASVSCPLVGQASVLTADLGHDSTTAVAPPGAPNGTPVSFSSTLAGSTMTPASGALSAALATSTLGSTSGGATNACATVDLERQCAVVNVIPDPPAASNNGPICEGATLQLSTPTVPGGTYAWSGPGGFTSTDQNPAIANATSADTGTYSVVVTVGACSSVAGTTSATVNVDATAPVVTPPAPIVVDQLVCCGVFGGITPSLSAALTTFLDGGSAVDDCAAPLVRLAPRVGGVDVAAGACFEAGPTSVEFRWEDAVGRIGSASATVTLRMYGDLNQDAVVDGSDYVILRDYLNFLMFPEVPPFVAPLGIADLNHDATVDPGDFVVMRDYMNFVTPCLAP